MFLIRAPCDWFKLQRRLLNVRLTCTVIPQARAGNVWYATPSMVCIDWRLLIFRKGLYVHIILSDTRFGVGLGPLAELLLTLGEASGHGQAPTPPGTLPGP